MDKVTYLEEIIRILWSYIPESDRELNENILREINQLEEE